MILSVVYENWFDSKVLLTQNMIRSETSNAETRIYQALKIITRWSANLPYQYFLFWDNCEPNFKRSVSKYLTEKIMITKF